MPVAYPKDGFCKDSGVSWAWCEDFDGQGTTAPAAFVPANSGIAFQTHSHMTVTGTTCDTSGTDCQPYVRGGSLFLNAEDGGFGMNVMRVEQPFDFANKREGRIHYRSDFKGHPRMHQTVHVSPGISNSIPDLRFVQPLEALNSAPAISINYIGDGGWPFEITLWKDGRQTQQFHADGPLNIVPGRQYDVDIYLSRTSLRIELDRKEVFNQAIPDLGFDRGYVYIAQLSYNASKIVNDGERVGDSEHRFLWDNLAFDGPSLQRNSLTPAGKQDVLFRAYNVASCTVRGAPADGPINPTNNVIFDTWHARLDANAAPVKPGDIRCVRNAEEPAPYGQPYIGDDIDIVKR